MTSIITIFIVVVFECMFIAMLIAQGKHRTKLARQEKITQLSTQIKRMQNTLRTLPAKYWTEELQDFIFQSLITAYKQSIEINPKQKEYLQSDMQLVINQRQQIKNNKQTSNNAIEYDKVNLYRSALKTLHSYIQHCYNVKRIPSSMAESLIEQSEIKMLEATCDFYSHAADNSVSKDAYREAHSHTQKAIEFISKSKHKEKFNQQSIELSNSLKDIQIKWREHTAEKNKNTNPNSLSQTLDALDQNEGQWEQKQDYD